jgi:ribosomal protein S21
VGGCAAVAPIAAMLSTQQQRGMCVVVDVTNNNVDKALGRLMSKLKDADLVSELRKREYHRTKHDRRQAYERAAYNRRVGQVIRDRLRWVLKKRRAL